ncbi:MAG TPA: helix-turn-helix transcriptional regulator [Blastocatellia bacterium]|nr:helix-turn-helix transcriptional regulator [Blastocatellia bacterium]
MTKPVTQYSLQDATFTSPNGKSAGSPNRRSPLAELVSEHLKAKGLRQVDFCRRTGFDQGLLSKIISSVVNTLNVETALKLAEGLDVEPVIIFEAIGKKEIDDLLRRFYSNANGENSKHFSM